MIASTLAWSGAIPSALMRCPKNDSSDVLKTHFFVELEPSSCYSFQHLLQVLPVFALRLAKNDYVIQVAQDPFATSKNLRHDLLKRSWCRCQPEADPLESKEAIVRYK